MTVSTPIDQVKIPGLSALIKASERVGKVLSWGVAGALYDGNDTLGFSGARDTVLAGNVVAVGVD